MPLGPPKPPVRESPLSREKAKLEITKLQLDIRYVQRTFRLQTINAIALILIGLAVLYFFQRPQLDSLEATRLATEKHQVATLLISVQAIANDADRKRMIEMLAQQWPSHDFLRAIVQSNRAIAQLGPCSTPGDLDAAINELQWQFHREITGGGGTGLAGYGPAAKAIRAQMDMIIELRLAVISRVLRC